MEPRIQASVAPRVKTPISPKSVVVLGCLSRKPSLNSVVKNFVKLCDGFTGTKEQVINKIRESLRLTENDLQRYKVKYSTVEFKEALSRFVIEKGHKYQSLILSESSRPVEREAHHHAAVGVVIGENPLRVALEAKAVAPDPLGPLNALLRELRPLRVIADIRNNIGILNRYFETQGGISTRAIMTLFSQIDLKVDRGEIGLPEARKNKINLIKVLYKMGQGDRLERIPLKEFNLVDTYVERDRVPVAGGRTRPLVSVGGDPTVIDNTRVLGAGTFGRAKVVSRYPSAGGRVEIVSKKIRLGSLIDMVNAYDEIEASRSLVSRIREAHGAEAPIRVLDPFECHFHIGKDGMPRASIYTQKYDGTLTDFLKPRLTTPKERLQVLLEASKALAQFHSAGWAHEDIKSDNFLVKVNRNESGEEIRDPEGNRSFTVVVADMGLAHPMGTNPTLSSSIEWTQMGGTLPSKEALQLRETVGRVDHAGHNYQAHDTFSFGVEILTSQGICGRYISDHSDNTITNPVYDWVRDAIAACRGVIEEGVRIPSIENRKKAAIAALGQRCIEDNPAARPTMQQVQDELQRIYEMV